ncbi:hypothetical protein ACFPM0_28140 [Pseudonocardia sulfidoxydans]|uniref:hypothetical protein n=1 Tax=Pseudonocardia sulfidoxydans TaxID=54011 RepID=UPI00361E2A05
MPELVAEAPRRGKVENGTWTEWLPSSKELARALRRRLPRRPGPGRRPVPLERRCRSTKAASRCSSRTGSGRARENSRNPQNPEISRRRPRVW